MKSRLCDFVEQNIWRYIDRELSARNVSEISGHLRGCQRCHKLFESRAREASLYRLAYVESPFGDGFAERFEEAFQDELDEASFQEGQAEIFTFNPPVKHRRMAILASIAAMLLVVLIGALLPRGGGSGREGAGRTVADGGSDRIGVREVGSPRGVDRDLSTAIPGVFADGSQSEVSAVLVDSQAPLRRRPELRAGVVYSAREPTRPVTMNLEDGSRLSFAQVPWRFRISRFTRPGGSFEGVLSEGRVDVSVETRRAGGDVFRIRTPNAIVEVIGTRFTVEVTRFDGMVQTEVSVERGEVSFEPLDREGERIRLFAGERESNETEDPETGRTLEPVMSAGGGGTEAGSGRDVGSREFAPGSSPLDTPVSLPSGPDRPAEPR